jgi:diphosphoinositol-polyphosphate diphosphatase
MTTEELSALAFDLSVKTGVSLKHEALQGSSSATTRVRNGTSQHQEVIAISSSSSTCTRESDTSDAEGNPMAFPLTRHTVSTTLVAATPPPDPLNREKVDQINAKVSQSKTSRQGRGSQRWVTGSTAFPPSSGTGSDQEDCNSEHIRLVTGCVPILKGGKILLVSASRKAEWILPKGGWEMDETLEESAIREVFEEAGVLGVLGPILSDFQYETRKSKKRKLEQAEMLEQKLKKAEEGVAVDIDLQVLPNTEPLPETAFVAASYSTSAAAPISKEDLTRIRSLSQEMAPLNTDETASCTSGHSSTYSQVRMTLLPLYVTKVLSSWPEQGRFRMAVDIDTAIEMQASRPEFKAALMEVKARGLHLVAA